MGVGGRSPLALLLAAVAIAVVAWALFVPPFQVPDEVGHFGYAQAIAEDGRRPARDAPPPAERFSAEQRFAMQASGAQRSLGDRRVKPAWDERAERLWRAIDRHFESEEARDVVAAGPQTNHSPFYYAYEAVPYRAAEGGDLLDRLYLMRLWSGALMLVTALGAWLLIGELTGRDRLLQLAGAACVGLQPMAVFVSAGVNPDALLFASWSMAAWFGVRVLRRGAAPASVAGLLAATALAALAKAAGLALLPGVLLVLAIAARRSPRARAPAVAAVGGAALLVAAALGVQRGLGRRAPADPGLGDVDAFASYLWQFYLPKLPFQQSFEQLGDLPAWHVWHKTSWGAFGQLEVLFPGAVYAVLAGVAVVVVAGAVAAVVRGAFRPGRAVAAFLLLPAAFLLLGLHWVEFRSLGRLEGMTTQGRYLLPLMPVAGVAVAAALRGLAPRRRAPAAGLVLAGMVALQLLSLAVVGGRFYA